jgi:glycosyltransferase involved in cell wall biosynthesis
MTTTTTASTPAHRAAHALRLALIAPPPATVPPASLGGLEQVRWLADGLAHAGHHVTLIGADLDGLTPDRYAVADTDPTGGQRATPELVDRLHAEQAGKLIEQLQVEVVSDHTRTGYLPASGHPQAMAQTLYQPIASAWLPPAARPPLAHLTGGYVAISTYQQRGGLGLPWLQVIHPGIPFDEYPLSPDHDGPCVYLGPLQVGHGARVALEAAHQAGRQIVVAGIQPQAGGASRAYVEIELRPLLGAGDRLLEQVTRAERRELLSRASCLVAPLRYDAPHSLEIVEAMAYGTPVVTMAGTVGAELVTHGTGGLVLTDPALLAGGIERAGRLDPGRVRADAAARLDVAVMVAGYQALFARLLEAGSR